MTTQIESTKYLITTPRPRRIKQSDVFVDTSDFRDAYGTGPRGEGNWAFTFSSVAPSGGTCYLDRSAPEWVPGLNTYSEAKKWAIRRAVELGAVTVHLCS